MNKNTIGYIACSAALLFGAAPSAFADAVYAKGERILLADDNLLVFDTGDPDTPLVTIPVGDATDVTVAGCNAIVTTDDGNAKKIAVVDLAGLGDTTADLCSSGDGDNACGPVTYDPDAQVLSIPCVDAFGTTYTLDMKRRGKSDNWHIDFIKEVTDKESNSGSDSDNADGDDD